MALNVVIPLLCYPTSYLPDGCSDLGLVLRKVDVLEDHVLAIAHKVLVVLVTQVATIRLPVVEGRAAIFSEIFQFFVDHLSLADFLFSRLEKFCATLSFCLQLFYSRL